MKIVLTHTEEFPFDCYEGNLANGEYAGPTSSNSKIAPIRS